MDVKQFVEPFHQHTRECVIICELKDKPGKRGSDKSGTQRGGRTGYGVINGADIEKDFERYYAVRLLCDAANKFCVRPALLKEALTVEQRAAIDKSIQTTTDNPAFANTVPPDRVDELLFAVAGKKNELSVYTLV